MREGGLLYEPLTKLSYQDKEIYQKTYEMRYYGPGAVHLGFELRDQLPTFFVLSPELVSMGMEIYRIDKKIGQLRNCVPNVAVKQFCMKCLIDEIYLTNRIEGVHSTRKELSQLLVKFQEDADRKPGRDRFEGLMAQYLKLQENAVIPLDTCQDIRSLYDALVLPDVLKENPENMPDGQIFRKDSASVVSKSQKVIHNGLYPETAIQTAMEKALHFLKRTDVEPLFKISAFHYLLEYIHPFYDGNGRLGRFIVSYLLSQELDPLIAYRLSYTIQENINAYYDAFKECNNPRNKGDVTPFLFMMLTMIKTSMEKLQNALEERYYLLKMYEDHLTKFPGAEKPEMQELYFFLVQASLFAEQGISLQELASCMKKGESTIRLYFKEIRSNGMLKKHQAGRQVGYSLDLRVVNGYLNMED